jgi:hypothetical protein
LTFDLCFISQKKTQRNLPFDDKTSILGLKKNNVPVEQFRLLRNFTGFFSHSDPEKTILKGVQFSPQHSNVIGTWLTFFWLFKNASQ